MPDGERITFLFVVPNTCCINRFLFIQAFSYYMLTLLRSTSLENRIFNERKETKHMNSSVTKFVETRWGKIWTENHNPESSGTPLLVVHGGPGFLSMPQVVADLADERPVIFYDQLGCGKSDKPADTSRFTVEHYVQELAAVRETLGLSQVHLLAQSWGAMLVAEYVLRQKPEGVASLILCGPLLSVPLWERDQRRHIANLPSEAQRIIAEAERDQRFDTEAYQAATMDFYRRHVCRLDPWPNFLLEALGQLNMDVYLTMWGPSEFTTTGSLKGADLLHRLPEISHPVLLLGGEHDEVAPDTLMAYRDAFPRGEMAVLPNASHCHHLEQPELYLATVRNFLHRVTTP